MAVEGKPLCRGNIFLGPHKLGSSSKPDALGDFGWCVSTSAENYMLAMSCLPGLAQDPAFAGVTSSKNAAAALGWEQQLLKRVAQTAGSDGKAGCVHPSRSNADWKAQALHLSSCVVSLQSHHSPCACSREQKLLPHPSAMSATSKGSPSIYQHGLCL